MKTHQITIDDWLWNWACENDPQSRANPAPHIRSLLHELVALLSAHRCHSIGHLVDNLSAENNDRDCQSNTVNQNKLPSNGGLCRNGNNPRSILPFQHRREPNNSVTNGGYWILSLDTKRRYDAYQDKGNTVKLILMNGDNDVSHVIKYDSRSEGLELHNNEYWIIDPVKFRRMK